MQVGIPFGRIASETVVVAKELDLDNDDSIVAKVEDDIRFRATMGSLVVRIRQDLNSLPDVLCCLVVTRNRNAQSRNAGSSAPSGTSPRLCIVVASWPTLAR